MGLIKYAVLLVVLSSIVFISGCSPFVENNTIEEIGPVIFWSLEEGMNEKLKLSTLVPPLTKERKRLITMQVNLIKEGVKTLNIKYYRELKSGQLRILLINEKIAKKGIFSLINTLLTDPDISPRLYIVIVEGDFEKYIKNQLKNQQFMDYYIYRMLRHYEKRNQGEITVVNFHEFIKKLYSPLSDPILPVFQVHHNNFTYKGTAFFRHDKLIATVKGMDDEIIQLLDNDHYLKNLPIPALSVSLGQVRSNVHVHLDKNNSLISIKSDLNCRIDEYQGNKNLLDQDELASLEKETQSYLEKQTKELLTRIQRLKVDPLQLGTRLITPFSKPISEKEWMNDWHRMKIDVVYHLRFQPLTDN